MELTNAGREWAERNKENSIVARVALSGIEWPDEHRDTAVRLSNDNGARSATANFYAGKSFERANDPHPGSIQS